MHYKDCKTFEDMFEWFSKANIPVLLFSQLPGGKRIHKEDQEKLEKCELADEFITYLFTIVDDALLVKWVRFLTQESLYLEIKLAIIDQENLFNRLFQRLRGIKMNNYEIYRNIEEELKNARTNFQSRGSNL